MISEEKTSPNSAEIGAQGSENTAQDAALVSPIKPSFDDWKRDIELRAMQHAPNFERYLVIGGLLFMAALAIVEWR